MTRLEPGDPADIYPRVTSRYRDLAFALNGDRGLPLLYAVLGNSPAMLSSWLDFAWSLRYEPKSARSLRELAILLVGHRLAAPYCVSAHDRMALEAGVTDAQLAEVDGWQQSSLFDEDQRIVFRLAEAMLRRDVQEALVTAVRERFGREQTVEIILTIAFYQMVAATTTTLDLQPGEDPTDRPEP
jgi:4-carboxymuconolactone decarboxylase